MQFATLAVLTKAKSISFSSHNASILDVCLSHHLITFTFLVPRQFLIFTIFYILFVTNGALWWE